MAKGKEFWDGVALGCFLMFLTCLALGLLDLYLNK